MLEANNDKQVNAHTDAADKITIIETSSVEIEVPTNETDFVMPIDQISDTSEAFNTIVSQNLSTGLEIQILDYENHSLQELLIELENQSNIENINESKDKVEAIKTVFLSKYNSLVENKGEDEIESAIEKEDFKSLTSIKSKFDALFLAYKNKKTTFLKNIKSNLENNLTNRLAIVEELKTLINSKDNIANSLKQLNDIRERWKNAGPIPKDKYNHVWNNYHFHIENFYDFLHLDREARDLDFKHNLEAKLKIIARCEELANQEDVNKAFRELQDLHRIWKEDIGPVDRENRELIWTRFSELTKQIHERRELIFEKLRGSEVENLEKKNKIIESLEILGNETGDSHNFWLAQSEKVEQLKNEYLIIGKVPPENQEETWSKFKSVIKDFNLKKNNFYKEIKQVQNNNLSKKLELIERAKLYAQSLDFEVTTPLMKQIQEEWKSIGYVPIKFSDKIWKEFRSICNGYFDNLKAHKNIESPEEALAYQKKSEYLEVVQAHEMVGDHKTDLDAIKVHIENWKGFGKVSNQKRSIEGKFNKILDVLFEKLSATKKDSDMIRFSNRMEQLHENQDVKKIESEKIFLIRKIEETKSNILQLENNIQFFANTKNAKKENSIVTDVRKKIQNHKEELLVLKTKLKQLQNIKSEQSV